jgi:hypothetical protein
VEVAAMAFGDGISWARCSQVLGDLSLDDRLALKAVQAEIPDAVPAPALASLQRFGLVKQEGQRWVLTDDGTAVVQWC